MANPDIPALFLVIYIVAFLLTVVVVLLIAWAIIRGAVLSALRKHHAEVQHPASAQYAAGRQADSIH